MQNWAGNYTYQAASIERPTGVESLTALVAASPRIRALGTRHSFNAIADSPAGTLVSLEHLNQIVRLDTAGPTPTVTVEAGITYGALGPHLHAAGFALANLASLPHISVAGSVATATHGSGEGNGCLSTSVAAMDWVTAGGTVRTLRRGDTDFDGAVVGLGLLGVVARLTLDLVPTFDVAQHVYTRVPMAAFVENLDAIAASAYSVSGFTDWQGDTINQVWLKCVAGRTPFDVTAIGGTPAVRQHHPLEGRTGNVASEGAGADACTRQLGEPGPWHERLPHFRPEFTPSSGEEIQSEYFVPREHAAAAIAAVGGLRSAIGPTLQITELRLIAADALWLSPFYRRSSLGIHFTWRKDAAAVAALLPRIEAALAPFDARPHWGKVFATAAAGRREHFPRAAAFEALRQQCDPNGKFLNAFFG